MTQAEKLIMEQSVEMIMAAIRREHSQDMGAVLGVLMEANHVLKTKLDTSDSVVYDVTDEE